MVLDWPADSIIYSIYPSIFSSEHSFNAITTQLGRLKELGATVIWLMPITPIGHEINGHPSVDSPYCVHDYYAVNPDYGTASDLHKLIRRAHQLGLKLMFDEVLNHTSWDNQLITQHPEYYVHSDGNPGNPSSISMAFNYADVAQLNYANPGLRKYMVSMLKFWIRRYKVDGFRFDCADNPDGPDRRIPADFWLSLGRQLRSTKPNLLMLGECQSPDLAMKPFTLEYGWHMYGALKGASNGGDAGQVKDAWDYQKDSYPVGMIMMSIQDDWDDPRDVNTFGGSAGAMAAAAFYFTDTGVPLIYNGMEIGNSAEAVNPRVAIDWHRGNPEFTEFYRHLITLRHNNPAFTVGSMSWLANTEPKQILTYERTSGTSTFVVEVNLSNSPVNGSISGVPQARWKEIRIAPEVAQHDHAALPLFSLGPKDFAIYKMQTDAAIEQRKTR
jgi:cyclomaltodextrinase